MRKFFIFYFFMLMLGSAFAQKEKVLNLPSFDKRKIHYGFYLGLNQNGFKVSYKQNSITNRPDVIVEPKIGFNVGLIADLRLHKNVNLRFEPGLVSNNKDLIFNHITGNDADRKREAGNTYLHLPFIFKFSTDRLNNVRPYVLAGVSYDHNFSSNEKNGDDNFFGEFRQNADVFMYEVGIGMDFYLPYFKFSPSIRGMFAINNELKYDNRSPSQWTDPIDFMGTRGFFIHLAFE